jgi:hypothetical protein
MSTNGPTRAIWAVIITAVVLFLMALAERQHSEAEERHRNAMRGVRELTQQSH